MNRRGVWLSGLLLAVFAVAWALWRLPAPLKEAPDIALHTIDGREIQLSSLRGAPVLITFWATSCASCVQEMPHLIRLYRELRPRGLEIIAVAMSYDPPDRVIRMAKARRLPYPVALDPQARLAQAFGGVRVTPTSFLIAPDGRIVRQQAGPAPMEAWRARILDMPA